MLLRKGFVGVNLHGFMFVRSTPNIAWDRPSLFAAAQTEDGSIIHREVCSGAKKSRAARMMHVVEDGDMHADWL